MVVRERLESVQEGSRGCVAAILDFGVGLIKGVFRVASQHKVPKGFPLVKNKVVRVKDIKKKKKIALVRDRTRDLS